MFVKAVQNIFSHLKDIQEIGVFTAMADSRLVQLFVNSPLFIVVLPLLAFVYTVLTGIKAYYLYSANNKNLSKWTNFIVSLIYTALTGTAFYSAMSAIASGQLVTVAPWFLFGASLLMLSHQILMLGLNSYRAFKSQPGSSQRLHFIQSSLNSIFNIGLYTAICGAMLFSFLLPVSTTVAVSCSVLAGILTVANLLWRVIPDNWKQNLKSALKLNRLSPNEETSSHSSNGATQQIANFYPTLFTSPDYSSEIKTMSYMRAITYLKNEVIPQKLTLYQELATSKSEKNQQKEAALKHVLEALEHATPVNKEEIVKKYPRVFQSFWREKGETEQIFDAVNATIGRKV